MNDKALQVSASGGPEEPQGGKPRWPWLQLWIRPRAMTRYYLNRPYSEERVLAFALIAGVISVITRPTQGALTEFSWISWSGLLIGSAVVGAAGGLLGMYLFGYLLTKAGGWLDGYGESKHVRTALVAGSCIPGILTGILWLPKVVLLGKYVFYEQPLQYAASGGLSAFLVVYSAVEWIVSVWALVVLVKALAEAHEFSAWRSLGAFIIALVLFLLILIVPIGILIVIFAGIAGIMG